MGTQNKRFRTIRNMSPIEESRCFMQEVIDSVTICREKIMELGLDMSFFKPILPSPRYLKTDLVGDDDDGIAQIKPHSALIFIF